MILISKIHTMMKFKKRKNNEHKWRKSLDIKLHYKIGIKIVFKYDLFRSLLVKSNITNKLVLTKYILNEYIYQIRVEHGRNIPEIELTLYINIQMINKIKILIFKIKIA